ncbi:peptidylprolyl isomerase [Gemmatimonadota bacterium]
MKVSFRILLMVALVAFAGCGKGGDATPDTEAMVEGVEPDYVEVQHLLVSYQGPIPNVTRTLEEAEALANELFERAQSGVDFDSLVEEYTNDQHPGIYFMYNVGIEPHPDREGLQYARTGMVKSFGDVGFSLQVGEFGMAVFDSTDSRYGWHIIKRLK